MIEFEFQNHDFGLIEEAKDDLYIRIERECRTAPFPGMKQPTPVGGILGHEVVLTVKHFGERVDKYRWELILDDVAVANGVTNAKGESRGLPIPFPYGHPKTYSIRVLKPLPEPEPEPIEDEQIS